MEDLASAEFNLTFYDYQSHHGKAQASSQRIELIVSDHGITTTLSGLSSWPRAHDHEIQDFLTLTHLPVDTSSDGCKGQGLTTDRKTNKF